MKRDFRKPLIIMTPKSLLRSKDAISELADMTNGGFQEVLDDPRHPADATKIVFCSGKVFYDLAARRDDLGSEDIALIRIEQLHPFPTQQIKDVIERYASARKYIWAQEEPRNRGAWYYMDEYRDSLAGGIGLEYIGRKASASTATGSYKQHRIELEEILAAIFQ